MVGESIFQVKPPIPTTKSINSCSCIPRSRSNNVFPLEITRTSRDGFSKWRVFRLAKKGKRFFLVVSYSFKGKAVRARWLSFSLPPNMKKFWISNKRAYVTSEGYWSIDDCPVDGGTNILRLLILERTMHVHILIKNGWLEGTVFSLVYDWKDRTIKLIRES